jgi:hypothetical protein
MPVLIGRRLRSRQEHVANALMRALLMVVGDVLGDVATTLRLVEEDHAGQTLGFDGKYKAFRESVFSALRYSTTFSCSRLSQPAVATTTRDQGLSVGFMVEAQPLSAENTERGRAET